MSKRTAQSPLIKDEPSKKQKVAGPAGPLNTDSTSAIPSPTSTLSSAPKTPTEVSLPETIAVPKKSTGPQKGTPKKATAKKATGDTSAPKKAATKKATDKKATAKEQPAPKKQASPKKSTKGAAPVADTFEPWTPPQPEIPDPSPYWGIIPIMRRANGDDEDSPLAPDPLPHPDQPAARTSNGATNPPMWEDLGFRFQRGSRYVKYTSVTAPDNADDLPETIDQEEHLQIKLIDMRPKSAKDRTPRRAPMTYHYGDDIKDDNGDKGKLGRKPKDWDNKQAVKCVNDRRAQAIGRITMDNAWTPQEREYLAELFAEFPHASIWEIAARHNSRFVGEFMGATGGLNFSYLSPGRTVESIRNQYMTYKLAYDRCEAPTGVRPSNNNSLESKEAAQKWKDDVAKKFGSPDKELEEEYDAGKDPLETWHKRCEEERKLAEGEDDVTEDEKKRREEAHRRFVKQHGEELIDLAGHTQRYIDRWPAARAPSQASTSPARESPQPTAVNQVVSVETKVHTERRVIEETVAEDGMVEQVATQTVVESVSEAVESAPAPARLAPASEKKRNASEVYREKMKAISEDYDDYGEEEEEEEEEQEEL